MHRPLTALPLALLLAAAAGAQTRPAHSLALINDPRSHGAVGDKLLSLNEAIQLSNQTLSLNRLSPEEYGQILGFGDVAFVDVDATRVPVLTLERDLDVVLDTAHGFILSGTLGTPVIDLGTTNGFVCDSDFADFKNVVLRGGRAGVTINQTDSLFGSQLEGVTFDGQGECGLRIRLVAERGSTRFNLFRLQFRNSPAAIEVHDLGRDRGQISSVFFLTDIAIRNVTQGIDVQFGPGGRTQFLFERVAIDAAAHALRFRRPDANATRELVLQALHLDCRGGLTALAIDGRAGARTNALLQMLDLSAPAGGSALSLGALGAELQAVVEDSRLAGAVQVSGGASSPITMVGNRQNGGTLAIGATGAAVQIRESILDGVTTSTQGSSPVAIGACRFVAGSATGNASAPITIDRSHLAGTTLGSHVTQTNPIAQPQLGSMDVVPRDPRIGTPVEWRADLPPGLAGYWVLGRTAEQPVIGPRPWNLYFQASTETLLPFPARNQDKLTIVIPNDQRLVGLDVIVQIVVVPDPGVPAPPVMLPPGRRFVIRA